MALSKVEAAKLPELFKNASAWAQKPEFHRDFAERATAELLPAANRPIFVPGSPVEYLYLIAEGVVEQTFGRQAQPWFRKLLRQGEFFGQQALFIGQHQSTATVISEATVFRLTAPDVRVLLEQYPDLRELLLQEQRASRLRSIPLFESLSDEEIRWLTFLAEATEIAAAVSVPVSTRRGLYVIDWGQLYVTGPASSERADWCLTCGNFFTSPGVKPGEACAATNAAARIKTRLLFLPEEHFTRIARAFPDVDAMAQTPLDIVGRMGSIPLLADARITPAHLDHLAQFCAWTYVPGGQNISTQGAVGYSFMIVHRGAALVSAVDDQGRLRPRSLLSSGGAFGTTSLTEGRPRDATVRAVQAAAVNGRPGLKGAELIILDRRDLRNAFADRPDLWRSGVRLYDSVIEVKKKRPAFDWLQEDEVVIWSDRSHWLWLAGPLILLLLAFIVFVAFVIASEEFAGLSSRLAMELTIAAVLVIGLIFVPSLIWVFSNYFDDYYVVTNRRITRRDRTLFIREVRTDAPLQWVQDVTIDTTLMGRLLGYGNLIVRTASKAGDVRFDNVPDPDVVRSYIMQEKVGVAAAARGQTKEMLRRGLINGLRLALAVPDPDQMRALGEDVPAPIRRTFWERLRQWFAPGNRRGPVSLPVARRRGKPQWFLDLTRQLPKRWQDILVGPPPPPPRPLTGSILWRKHWVDYLGRAGRPLLAVIILLLLMVLVGLVSLKGLGLTRVAAWLGLLALLIPAGVWLWYEWQDYWNDVYIITDEKIIDIEKKPLALSLKQREGGLDKVQTVFVEQNGIWANVLNYGNVVIRTAAADEGFTFQTVGSPRQIQKVLFQKLDAHRRRQDEKAIAERQRGLIEGLEVYHELREEQDAREKR